MLLAVDVGNTSTGLALISSSGRIRSRRRIPTPASLPSGFLDGLVPAGWRSRLGAAVVSSVVPRLDRELSRQLRDLLKVRPFFVSHRCDCGLALRIDRPSQLGADRIADCAGALRLFSPPFMVIDSGTATTFDLVSRDAAYIGGCILPGVEIGLQSLAEKTAKLGFVRFAVPRTSLGTNTVDSIRAGVFFGYLGALSRLIGEYRKKLGTKATVIATGGMSRVLRNRLPEIDAYQPDLIYIGLHAIHERNR